MKSQTIFLTRIRKQKRFNKNKETKKEKKKEKKTIIICKAFKV